MTESEQTVASPGGPSLGWTLLIEAFLFCVPFLVNASANKWHWVNDEGPSFLVYILLGYGSWVLMGVVALVYVGRLLLK